MSIKDTVVPFKESILNRSVDSALPIFFRNIMEDLNIDEGRFLVNVDKYVRKTIEPENFKEISSIRTNLRKELMRPVMTWKVFIRGLKVLNVKQFDFAVKAEIDRKGGDEGPTEVTVVYRVCLDPKASKEPNAINKTDIVLATAFKAIMHKLGVNISRFMKLIADYIVRSNVPINTKEISSTRGNLKKELFKNAITWKVFVKGLSFLQVKRFTLYIYLHHYRGTITEHYLPVNLDDIHSQSE